MPKSTAIMPGKSLTFGSGFSFGGSGRGFEASTALAGGIFGRAFGSGVPRVIVRVAVRSAGFPETSVFRGSFVSGSVS